MPGSKKFPGPYPPSDPPDSFYPADEVTVKTRVKALSKEVEYNRTRLDDGLDRIARMETRLDSLLSVPDDLIDVKKTLAIQEAAAKSRQWWASIAVTILVSLITVLSRILLK